MNREEKEKFLQDLVECILNENNFIRHFEKVVKTCKFHAYREEVQTQVLVFIKKGIKDSNLESLNKYLLLMLLKQLFEKIDGKFRVRVKDKFKNRLGIMGMFRWKDNEKDKGKTLFGNLKE